MGVPYIVFHVIRGRTMWVGVGGFEQATGGAGLLRHPPRRHPMVIQTAHRHLHHTSRILLPPSSCFLFNSINEGMARWV